MSRPQHVCRCLHSMSSLAVLSARGPHPLLTSRLPGLLVLEVTPDCCTLSH